jgi:hypothetical protein
MNDPRAGDPTHGLPYGGDDVLAVLVGGGGGEPERLLHIGRPLAGTVRVREWTSDTWSAPVQYDVPADALLNELERAAQQRRRLSEEIYRIRLWLTGQG